VRNEINDLLRKRIAIGVPRYAQWVFRSLERWQDMSLLWRLSLRSPRDLLQKLAGDHRYIRCYFGVITTALQCAIRIFQRGISSGYFERAGRGDVLMMYSQWKSAQRVCLCPGKSIRVGSATWVRRTGQLLAIHHERAVCDWHMR
jgi:hypothetical protein